MKSNDHTIAILVYNNHQITIQMVDQLIKTGINDYILFYDNGSTPPFISGIKNDNFSYHRNPENIYVNPAWNEIFDIINTKYLTLLNNDCFIESANYFNDILEHMENNDIVLSSCKTRNISTYSSFTKKIYELKYCSYNKKPLIFSENARRQGWLMTINLEIYKTLDYKIPKYLKLWYGDDWIWSQVIKNKLKYAIYTNRYALHIRSSSSSKLTHITDNDTKNLQKHGDWFFEITNEMHSKRYV